MKGDFSRTTFDPGKHYTSVRMQQGRMQLDADWNEQADILLHLIAAQLRDLLGPGGTTVTEPGFAITPVEPANEELEEDQAGLPEESTKPVRTLPDFEIGPGRYYVDGILCENEAPVLYSQQPDYPAAASRPGGPLDTDRVLVYLDVWQRHISAAEDPTIRETALGGLDTTTRVKTVWQVKPLPLPGAPADDPNWRDPVDLRSLADWQAFVAQTAGRGCLQARWQDVGAVLENRLYRVEIHSVGSDRVAFKWSPENGSVVFPIREAYLFTWEDAPGKDRGRLLLFLRENCALDWVEEQDTEICLSADGKTIHVKKDGDWAKIVLDEGGETATLSASRDDTRFTLQVSQENDKRKVYTYIRRIKAEPLFTWEDAPDKDRRRLFRFLREGFALDWVKGEDAEICADADGKTIHVKKDGDWAKIVLDEGGETATLSASRDDTRFTLQVSQENDKRKVYLERIELQVEGLDRDPFQLAEGHWGEIADDVTVLGARPLPLCQTRELNRLEGRVTLGAAKASIDRIITEIGQRRPGHPLLRRWEGLLWPERDKWQAIEKGIQVRFTGGTSYRPGDYWLIPARTHLDEGIEWPRKDGHPQAQLPHGIAHHYAPLALLQFQDGGWHVTPDEDSTFRSLPQTAADLRATHRYLDAMRSNLQRIGAYVVRLQRQVTELEELKSRIQAHIYQDFLSTGGLEKGDVVAFLPAKPPPDPDRVDRVTPASKENERQVVGVVAELIDDQRCRVALYGRIRCKVIGQVEPGDLLVPSREPGRAQKADWYVRPGTVLGKALGWTDPDQEVVEEIEEGRLRPEDDMSKQPGTVDVLVTLG